MIRTIDVLLFDGVNMLDVSGPVQAFENAISDGQRRYAVNYVSRDGNKVRASCGLALLPDGQLSVRSGSKDLMIPGGRGVDALCKDGDVLDAIRQRAFRKGDGRLISICSGALVLAAAGVLDDRRATTHWSRSEDIQQYSGVFWDLDQINIRDGFVFTSAGVTTGIDLALDIIKGDCGPSVALATARELVVQLRRTGGQSQYAIHLAGQFTREDRLSRLIETVVSRPHLNWTLETMAKEAGMNERTLTRHFRRDLDETPAQFVERTRVDHARGLIADHLPLKQVASDSGFGDLQRMRRAFQRRFGVSVTDYANSFG